MKTNNKKKSEIKNRRAARVRSIIFGTAKCPRLSISKTLKNISAQLIDDSKGVTVAYFGNKGLKGKKIEQAAIVGKGIADKAQELKIKEVVFDRGASRYHGRVKALADAAREAGLKF